MSPRAPRLTAKDIIKRLKNSGFVEVGQKGSHLKLFNAETRHTAIVPVHSKKTIPVRTVKAIEKQSGINLY